MLLLKIHHVTDGIYSCPFYLIIEKYGIDWGDVNAERGESEQ